MNYLTESQLTKLLLELGLQPGDGVLIHSALHYLGKPVGGMEMYYQTLASILDLSENEAEKLSTGTIAVPTFNFAFARGEPFDLINTPSVGMGAFSEFIRRKPNARRTPHPLQSIAIIGRYADDLARRDTPSAFDPGSPFDRMLELDFKILLLGADVQAISLLHWVEQRLKVPYRYWKEFHGLVHMGEKCEKKTARMFVRDLELNPQLDLHPVQRLLEERGEWLSHPLNYGRVSVCCMRDFVVAVEEFLCQDPWSLVTNRPK